MKSYNVRPDSGKSTELAKSWSDGDEREVPDAIAANLLTSFPNNFHEVGMRSFGKSVKDAANKAIKGDDK